MSIYNHADTVKFIPPITGGTVVRVYDGDSITVASRLPHQDSPLYRFPVRINGIDCAELRSKSQAERAYAKATRDFVSSLLFGKHVALNITNIDKYGRLLCDVLFKDEDVPEIEVNIADVLIEKKMAVPYFGGRKQKIDWGTLK